MTALEQISEALSGGHGCISFSPTKGFHCDLMCEDKNQSWVTGNGASVVEAVENALQLKKDKER